jgi:hypothetical protein
VNLRSHTPARAFISDVSVRLLNHSSHEVHCKAAGPPPTKFYGLWAELSPCGVYFQHLLGHMASRRLLNSGPASWIEGNLIEFVVWGTLSFRLAEAAGYSMEDVWSYTGLMYTSN